MRAASLFIAFITGTIFTSFIVVAWTGPTEPAPGGNIAPPLNAGDVDQIKDGGLFLNALGVDGNAILFGASRYLSFGTIPGASGYGIRDNAGTMEFKNTGGSWAGVVTASSIASSIQNFFSSSSSNTVEEINFADGTTQTTAAANGVLTCPSGFTKLQSQGRTLGCIQNADDGTATQPNAALACFNKFGARLPLAEEMQIARAVYPQQVSGILSPYSYEWVSCGGGYVYHCPVFNASGTIQSQAGSNTLPYRCFIPPGANS